MYTASPLRVGQVLEISFPRLKPQITVHSQRELTVEIVAGEISGSPILSSMRQSWFATAW
jgi:hypothetical protein